VDRIIRRLVLSPMALLKIKITRDKGVNKVYAKG